MQSPHYRKYHRELQKAAQVVRRAAPAKWRVHCAHWRLTALLFVSTAPFLKAPAFAQDSAPGRARVASPVRAEELAKYAPGALRANAEKRASLATPSDEALVTRIALIDAGRDVELQEIRDGDVIDLDVLPTRHLNIRVDAAPTVERVLFQLDENKRYREEVAPPFALAGDKEGDFRSWTPRPGEHHLAVVPFEKGTRQEGRRTKVTFIVIGSENGSGNAALARRKPGTTSEEDIAIGAPEGSAGTEPLPTEATLEPGPKTGPRTGPEPGPAMVPPQANAPIETAKLAGQAAERSPEQISEQASEPLIESTPSERNEPPGAVTHGVPEAAPPETAPPQTTELSKALEEEGHTDAGDADGADDTDKPKPKGRCMGFINQDTAQLTVACSHTAPDPARAKVILVNPDQTEAQVCEFLNAVSPIVTTCPTSLAVLSALHRGELLVDVERASEASPLTLRVETE